MATWAQRSFAGGELSPAMYARVDMAKYQSGARKLRNMQVMRHGGAQNRAGFEFVAEVKDSSKRVKLFEFIFDDDQTYVLEFGNLYMRIHSAGAPVVVSGVAAWSNATAYVPGDLVVEAGVNYYCIVAHTNQIPPNATYWYPLTGNIYEIPTPYLETHLQDIHANQSNDVITLTHKSYDPMKLSRSGHTNWGIAPISFSPKIAAPTGVGVAIGGAGAKEYDYVVTAVAAIGFEESLPAGYGAGAATIIGIVKVTVTRIFGVVIDAKARVETSAAHNFYSGQEVLIAGIVGMSELNGRRFRITVTDATHFDIQGANVAFYAAYSSAGTATPTSQKVTCATPTDVAPNVITWTGVDGAREYNVYRAVNGVYGFIGVAIGLTFSDPNITPDIDYTPPIDFVPFVGEDDRPATSGRFQQRQVFGGSDRDPSRGVASRINSPESMSTRFPAFDNDSIVFSLAGDRVNRIRHILDLGKLIILTTDGEFVIGGNDAGAITPAAVLPRRHSTYGSSKLKPIIIGPSAIFCQKAGSIVRDLFFDITVDGYQGNDLTIMAAHLFDNYNLTDWAFQQIPQSIIWVVRDDGILLGFTYIREHQIWAWHRHDTDGLFENAVVVPEVNSAGKREDRLYVVVKRTINGATKRYIERMATRRIGDIVDSIFSDSTISFDGRNGDPTLTMTLSGGVDWLASETLTLSASAPFFAAGDVGNAIFLYDADDFDPTKVIRCTIKSYGDPQTVTVKPHKTVPVGLRGVATAIWAEAIKTVTNLDHLEGKLVSVFADGFVVGSPYNEKYTPVTVTAGEITLARPYSVIRIGLPYIADLETLDIDTVQSETMAGKAKLVTEVTLFVQETRGVWAGGKPPSDDEVDALEGLMEFKARDEEGYDEPVELRTDTIEIPIESEWNSNGRVFVRQTEPIPMTVLAIAPAAFLPLRG